MAELRQGTIDRLTTRVCKQSEELSGMQHRSRAICFWLEDSRSVRYRVWVSREERWVYIHNFAGLLTGHGGARVRLTYGLSFLRG